VAEGKKEFLALEVVVSTDASCGPIFRSRVWVSTGSVPRCQTNPAVPLDEERYCIGRLGLRFAAELEFAVHMIECV